jgi:MFS family permease
VFAAGAVAQSLLARLGTRRMTATGLVLLVAGLALLTVATWLPDLAAFLAGGVLCGSGAGLLTKGGIDIVLEVAPEEVRAEGLATFFLASYLGLSVPIVGLGVATQYVSGRVSLLGFAGVLVLALTAVGPLLLGKSPRRRGRTDEISYQGAGT